MADTHAAPRGESTELAELRRWEDLGGTWAVLSRRDGRLTLSWRRCDGGEEAHRTTTADADVLAHVGARSSSED